MHFLPSPSKPYVTQHDEITVLTFEQRHKFAIHFFAEINLEENMIRTPLDRSLNKYVFLRNCFLYVGPIYIISGSLVYSGNDTAP